MFELVVFKVVGNDTGTIGSDNGFGDIAVGHQEADARLERDDLGLKRLDAHLAKHRRLRAHDFAVRQHEADIVHAQTDENKS